MPAKKKPRPLIEVLAEDDAGLEKLERVVTAPGVFNAAVRTVPEKDE